jgi:hypothetical protein
MTSYLMNVRPTWAEIPVRSRRTVHPCSGRRLHPGKLISDSGGTRTFSVATKYPGPRPHLGAPATDGTAVSGRCWSANRAGGDRERDGDACVLMRLRARGLVGRWRA